jgi:hypothetical protein
MSQQIYELSIRVDTPLTVIEGERFQHTYHITNVGSTIFPGANLPILVMWAKLGPTSYVRQIIPINAPLNPTDRFEYSQMETPLADGYTIFTPELNQNDEIIPPTGIVRLFLEDRRRIHRGMLFGAVRARSHEEILQERELRLARRTLLWAIAAFGATVFFALVDTLLKLLLPY